jgi:hypothetical protein
MSQDIATVIRNITGKPTVLRYAASTNPFPLQASATGKDPLTAQLIITATNPDPDPDHHKVALQGIMIQIPIGTAGDELCPDATDIHPVPPTGWQSPTITTPTGFVQYTFLPQKPPAEIGSVGLQFVFNDVTINDRFGTVEIDVSEGSNNCRIPNCPVYPLSVTKFPNGWGQVSFWVDPPTSTPAAARRSTGMARRELPTRSSTTPRQPAS